MLIGPALTALIVDDNADAAGSLAVLLSIYGHDVHVAVNPEAAVDAAHRCRPDAVILDIGSRHAEGCALANRLATLPLARPLLVGLTSYVESADDLQECRDGFDNFFVEPADPAEMVRLLQGHAEKLAHSAG